VSAQLIPLVPDQEDIVGPPREFPVPPPPQGEAALLPEGLAEELEDGVFVSRQVAVYSPLNDGYSLPFVACVVSAIQLPHRLYP